MKASQNAIELIKHFEGCKLQAYKCPAGIWTIGYGSTHYESGANIKQGDTITHERAEELLKFDIRKFEVGLDKIVKSAINQNQYDALLSFSYNLGLGNLEQSRLLSRVNKDPSDIWIEREFEKWCNVNQFPMPGLLRRRRSEYWLYSRGELKFDFNG